MQRLHKEKGVDAALDFMFGYLKKEFEKVEKKKGKKKDKAIIAPGGDVLSEYAKENRANPTPSEARFKKFLSKNNIEYKFQVPVRIEGHGYIIDFVIHSKSLKKDIAVEIDGGYHDDPEQARKDKERENNLKRCGYEIIRLKNEETEKDKIYDVTFKKMKKAGASDVLNKITAKRFMN